MKTAQGAALRRRLEALAGRRIDLAITNNVSSYISFDAACRPMRLRLHRSFLHAPAPVIRSLGAWLRARGPQCPEAVRSFIDNPPPEVTRRYRVRRPPPETRGHCHDLERIFRQVNRRYFRGRLRLSITWGRRGTRRTVGTRTIGALYERERLIVISPVLDQWSVPEWFVAYTVFHECLHAVQPRGEPAHGRWFRQAEARYPDHAAAQAWQRRHARLLTGSLRAGQGDAALARLREFLDF